MKDYSKILKEITEIINDERKSVEFTASSLNSLVQLSLSTYNDIKEQPKEKLTDFNLMLISLETFTEGVIAICNAYLLAEPNNPDFVHVVTRIRNLHNEMLASLILLRSNPENITDINLS